MQAAGTEIGKPLTRVDGVDKVRGRTRYAADEVVPGVAYAALVQATIPRGRIVAFNLRDAAAMAGVLAVMTPENCPHLQPPPAEMSRFAPSERRAPLADMEVHYIGQHIAIVVAESEEIATAAAHAITVHYEQVPALLHARQVAREAPEQDRHAVRHGVYRPDHFTKMEAEKLQYRREATGHEATGHEATGYEATVRETYRTPVVHHNPIEMSSTIALWEGDRLLVYDSTRWLAGSRDTLATAFGIAPEKVRVLSPFVGGAFGSKGFLWGHVVLCAAAARIVGRPVKLVLSRSQMFTSNGHRPETEQEVALTSNVDGRLTHLEHHTVSTTSPLGNFTEPCGMVSRNLYACPNVRISHRVARVNQPTPCFMRAPGESSGVFALESAMDELAYLRGIDPLELRLRNYAEVDQDGGKPWSGKHLRACYEQGAQRFGWEERAAAPGTMTRQGRRIGYGMATAVYPGRRMEASAHAEMLPNGRARVTVATHEIGTGVRTVLTQIAADALGMPAACIDVLTGDSDFPTAPFTGASQTSATVGPAVQAAATALRLRIAQLAVLDPESPMHGLRPSEVTMRGGTLRHPEAPRQDSLPEVIRRNPNASLLAEGNAKPGEEQTRERFSFDSFGAHFVEVSVGGLGDVRVERWVGIFDGGAILNEKTARSQIVGGILFGLGMALLEETVHDPQTGCAVNRNLGEYLIPTYADTPHFDVSFVQYPDLHLNPLGARGIGELGIVGAPAAIASAVFHATGKRVRTLPIRPELLQISL